MKKIIYILPLFILFSCGGTNNAEVDETAADSLFNEDHKWIVSAKELKKKLGDLQKSFTVIGNKEVEETICGEDATIPYNGNKKEMNIWLMSTYMLDNFSNEEFGKHNFEMPPAMIRNEIPLSELNWMNFNSLDSAMFDVFKHYPDVTNIPKKNETGLSNGDMLQKTDMVLKAMKDGLFCVVVITDYRPPVYINDGKYEAGYVMGYILFADWDNDQLSCISPFLAQNSAQINFGNASDETVDNADSKEVTIMKADLQTQTFNSIDSIARIRTGFSGDVWVNNAANLERYKD